MFADLDFLFIAHIPSLTFLLRGILITCLLLLCKTQKKRHKTHLFSLPLVCVFVCVFSFFCGALSREMMYMLLGEKMREKWQHKFASKFNTLRARQRKKKNTTGGRILVVPSSSWSPRQN